MAYHNPQEVIRRHVETALDWEWRETAVMLYQWAERFNTCFFGSEMPDALLSFERMDHRILAAYTLKRNAQGLLYEITFNVNHLERPLWETLETLLHEVVHLWQQNYGQNPVTRNYHNLEFVARCEQLGLHPHLGSGVHLRPADGPFAELLTAHGIEAPVGTAPVLGPRGKPLDWWVEPGSRERGRSTLSKWSCGCQNVRVGTKEFFACCTRCGSTFVKVEPDGQEHRAGRRGSEEMPDSARYRDEDRFKDDSFSAERGMVTP